MSGTTLHECNEHGELVETTDARSVVTTRTVDALDRVTLVDYPDDSQNVTYTYDTGANALGRLSGISRHSATVSYAYDGFGRLVTDGALSYDYDDNGNRMEIDYPGEITASFAYDFADREISLDVDLGSGPEAVAGQAAYLPSGPLAGLVLGNGVIEQRGFDQRYFPTQIRMTGETYAEWTYDTDSVSNYRLERQREPMKPSEVRPEAGRCLGNVLEIERLTGCIPVIELVRLKPTSRACSAMSGQGRD